jgi:hypothetical protein
VQRTEKAVYTAYHLLGPVPSDLMERRDRASRRRRGGPAREAVPPTLLGALASLVDEVRPHTGAAHPRSRVTQASRRPSPALPHWPCLGRVGALGSKARALDHGCQLSRATRTRRPRTARTARKRSRLPHGRLRRLVTRRTGRAAGTQSVAATRTEKNAAVNRTLNWTTPVVDATAPSSPATSPAAARCYQRPTRA